MKKNILFFLSVIINWASFQLNATVSSGQHFILNPPATYDKVIVSNWLEQTKPAGIILFAGHCTERAKTKNLVSFLQEEAQKLGIPPLLIAIDWEGGIVSRLNEEGGFASIPSPWSLANAGRSACFTAGMLVGQQMRSIGANLNFAPSLDLFFPDNHILATRCFSSDPEQVATSGIAFAQGLLTQGVTPVFKHFPGLGLGRADTHLASTIINVNDQAFNHNIFPFIKALELDTPVIMCTHAIINKFGTLPITLSRQAVEFIHAKNKNSLLITDDFSMKAVQANKTVDQAALQALTAGHHLIIFSGATEDQINLINKMDQKKARLSKEQQKQLAQQQEQIVAFKQKAFTQPKLAPPMLDEHAVAQSLAKSCIQKKNVLPTLKNKKIIMLSTDLTKIRPPESWFVQKEQSYLGTLLNKRQLYLGAPLVEHILNPLDQTSSKQLTELIATIPADALVITQTFFYADNVWNSIQQQWLEQLKPLQDRLIAISLGHPKEQTILPQAPIINLGSFHKPMLKQAAALLCAPRAQTGADQLASNLSTYLQNKRFGLLCHRCSVTSDQQFLPDFLYQWTKKQTDKTKLAALFSPEHGLLGSQEDAALIHSEKQSKWNCPIYSLHGKTYKPTSNMLKDLDLLIVDLQEVGVRCFTYLSTLHLALEACAENKLSLLVLDRPNPLIHWKTRGPMLEKEYESFLGNVYVPFLHGSTIGKLAQKINQKQNADLRVLGDTQPETSPNRIEKCNPFIAPSPNLMSQEHLLAYPLTVFLEATNYSEGRGTKYPFLQIGAPWVNKNQLAQQLNQQKFTGIYFEPITFTPQRMPGIAEKPKHENKLCSGVFVHLYDQKKIDPIKVAQTILKTLFTLYPDNSNWLKWGNRYAVDLRAGTDKWRKEISEPK